VKEVAGIGGAGQGVIRSDVQLDQKERRKEENNGKL